METPELYNEGTHDGVQTWRQLQANYFNALTTYSVWTGYNVELLPSKFTPYSKTECETAYQRYIATLDN